MSDPVIEIPGLDELIAALSGDFGTITSTVLVAVTQAAKRIIAPYPPAPPQNAKRWYERGYGPKWRLADGSVKGKKTSEGLGRRWATVVSGSTAHLTNVASYAHLVHAADYQAALHKKTGWKTDQQAIDALIEQHIVDKAVVAALKGWFKNYFAGLGL